MDKKNRVDVENKFHQAEELMNSNSEQALSKLDGINPNDLPENLRYYYFHLAGHIHYIREDFDDAIICYNLALKNPDLDKESTADIYTKLSGIYVDKELYIEAIDCAKKAIELSPSPRTMTGALDRLALSYQNMGDFKQNSVYLLHILNIYKEKRIDDWSKYMIESSYASLCFTYWKLNDENKSDHYFQKLISLKDANPHELGRVYLCKAHRFYEKRQWKDALEYYNKAVSFMNNGEDKQHYQKYIDDCNGWLDKKSNQ